MLRKLNFYLMFNSLKCDYTSFFISVMTMHQIHTQLATHLTDFLKVGREKNIFDHEFVTNFDDVRPKRFSVQKDGSTAQLLCGIVPLFSFLAFFIFQ